MKAPIMDISGETLAAVEEAVGTADKAATWLRRPCAALHNHAPIDLLRTEEGRHEVQTLLDRIFRGIAA